MPPSMTAVSSAGKVRLQAQSTRGIVTLTLYAFPLTTLDKLASTQLTRSTVLTAADTLYDHKGIHFFRGCYIEGIVDFVFGNGRSM